MSSPSTLVCGWASSGATSLPATWQPKDERVTADLTTKQRHKMTLMDDTPMPDPSAQATPTQTTTPPVHPSTDVHTSWLGTKRMNAKRPNDARHRLGLR
ncbi:hypothetical protein K443DRAFT_11688 [Laccaria amethystina LaAM-08-1]|uniref:Uncharacterized protein n=1 Tax=Laccaria amethystina LaAM-08-1 TaxID=1095629 RepID=A0A0C9WT34_9AGAR|nr:hypothetical protein K443DRAFT_11688 [Laccaria amethystina LaAM-08-1]